MIFSCKPPGCDCPQHARTRTSWQWWVKPRETPACVYDRELCNRSRQYSLRVNLG
jgi:hypothetical protein